MLRFAPLLALLALAGPAAAAGDGIHVRTLDNGLRVVVREDHGKPLAALRIYVGTGGALEMEYLGAGISHYYEHLLSGGSTTTRPEAESTRILREIGGQSNAYTTSDLTCYHVTTIPEFLPRAMELYADWMRGNVLDPTEVDREKGVILKEMNKGEEEPNRVAWNLLMGTMYRVHPMRVPNIGYRENFERLTRDDLLAYYQNRYAPNNAVLAVAGDVDPEEVFRLAEEHFAAWERRPVPVVVLPEEPRQTAPRRAVAELDVTQAVVRMAFPTIDLFDPDLYALDMASAVLSTGRSSRLHRRIVEERALTDSIDTWSSTPAFRRGEFGVAFSAPPGNVEAIRAAVFEEFARLASEPPTVEELDRAKTLVAANHRLGLQTVEDQAEAVGMDLLRTGDPRFSQRYVERLLAVPPEAVRAAAEKYLVPERETYVQVLPRGTAKAAAAAEGDVAAAPAVETRRVELVNGVVLVVRRTPGVVPVGIQIFAPGGVIAEPPGKNGASYLASRLLLKGTTERDAATIARQVEEIGAAISARSGNNTLNVGMTLGRGAGDLPFAAELLAEILADAAFPAAEFEKEKRIAGIVAARRTEDWQAEAIDFLAAEIFPNHPYGRPSTGTPESIAGLTREDVVGFARSCLAPDRIVVAAIGDLPVDEAVATLSAALGQIPAPAGLRPRSEIALPEWTGGSFPADRRAFLPNEKTQAVLAIGFAGIPWLNLEDRAALLVVDAFTSGIGLPSGWFHHALRGEKSLVYFVHYSISSGVGTGWSYVYTQTEPSLLPEVRRRLFAEIDRLRKGEYTDEDVAIGRAIALTADPYYGQTVEDQASELALSELYGAGIDGLERFRKLVAAVGRADVKRVVEKYLGATVEVVTGPESVRPIFESLAAPSGE